MESVSTLDIGRTFTRYASAQLPSVSMTRRALQRYTRDLIEIVEEINSVKRISRVSPIAEEWVQTLLAAFKGDDRNTVIDRIAKIAKQDSGHVLLKRFADFGDFLLRTTALSGRRLSVKEAKGATKLILEEMLARFDGRDPGKIESAVLDGIYLEAMMAAYDRAASEPARRRLFNAIQEFDRYLVHNCGKVPVSPECNLRGWRELAKVDANPITIELYDAILERIDADEMVPPERRTIAILLVALAFRCGLRRLEALLPRIEDFLIKVSRVLLIRGHKLKSAQARRKVLLKLLSESEWKRLVAWIDERLGEEQQATLQDFLFGNSKENLALMPETIFDWINEIMRDITGDPTISLHQLRHSYATLLFFSLTLSDLDVIPDPFGHLRSTRNWLNESRARRDLLYRNSQPLKRHLYLVARDLAHLSPETSAGSYIHCFDWLLRILLDRSEFLRPDPALVPKASRRSKSTLARWASDLPGPMSVPVGIWYSRFPELKPKSNPDDSAIASRVSRPSGQAISHNKGGYLDPEWKLLYRCARENSLHNLKAADQTRVKKFREKLDYIFWLKLGNWKLRHRKQNYIPDQRHPDQVHSLDLPRRPNSEENFALDRLGIALDNLRANNLELFQKGITIFVHRVEKDNFVRFESPDIKFEADEALVYLQFLEQLGFEFEGLEFVSGDRHAKSEWRSLWREVLGLEDYRKRIEHPRTTKYFGRKSSLSVRPLAMKGQNFAGGASFRFAMVMALVVYGELPDLR